MARRVALIVGVERYRDSKIRSLKCVQNDCTRLDGFFDYGAKFDVVRYVVGKRAEQIIDEAHELVTALSPGDSFLFYFSGHGVERDKRHLLLCAKAKHDYLVHGVGAIAVDVLSTVTKKEGIHRIFILDACRSELSSELALPRGLGGDVPTGFQGEGVLHDIVNASAAARTKTGSFGILCSCSEGQVAPELPSIQHGLFTKALLDFLEESYHKGTAVRLSDELCFELKERMARLAQQHGLPSDQRPWHLWTGEDQPVLLPERLTARTRQTEPIEKLRASDDEDDPFVGYDDYGETRLGKYFLMHRLGVGGMGQVWLANDTIADNRVAIKMLPKPLRANAEELQRLKRSFQLVRELPPRSNICQLYDLVNDDIFGYCIVMQYIDGETLSRYRFKYVEEHGRFDLSELVRLLRPIAEALDFAHGRGVLHRDVKPNHILVSRNASEAWIIDFQLAWQIRTSVQRDSREQVPGGAGTFPYMACELWKGLQSSPQSDQYAFAMTVYELLTGELPYEASDAQSWSAIVTNPNLTVPVIGWLPPYAQRALAKALHCDPSDRFQTCRQFIEVLAGEGEPSAIRISQPKESSANRGSIDLPSGARIPSMNRYALVSGINDYEDRDNIQTLRFAVEDARRVDRFLHACGFEVHSLFDSEATLDRMHAELEKIAKRLEPDDVFFFYFSGHGYEPTLGDRRQFLLPRNANRWVIAEGGSGAVAVDFIEKCTRKPGVRRALVLDACRGPLSPHKGAGAAGATYSTKDLEQVSRQASNLSPAVIVCSCHSDQLAYEESQVAGGIFTSAMLSVFDEQRLQGGEIGFTPLLNERIENRLQSLFASSVIPSSHRPTPFIAGPPAGVVLIPGTAARKSVTIVQPPQLRIVTEPAGAAIEVDGKACGCSPLELPLEPGRHRARATLDGFRPIEQWFEFEGKTDAQLELPLVRVEQAVTERIQELVPTIASVALRGMEGAKAGQIRDDNGLKTPLVWIPPGDFTMGSPTNEIGHHKNEGPVKVELTTGFWLGQHVVTQSEWQRVMQTSPWSGKEYVKEGDHYPATYVSWDDAMEFCEKLTDQERSAGRLPSGWRYTLPTEAQWEYACRAGTRSRFSFGDDESNLPKYGWFAENADAAGEEYPHLVGQKRANPWGLYDMHGNITESCRDRFDEKLEGGTDPQGPSDGNWRVCRGGSWNAPIWGCRSAYRSISGSGRYREGFRLAAVPSGK